MGRRRGAIEEWLKRIFFGEHREHYVIFIKHRANNEEMLKPIPGDLISDIRRGYIHVKSGEVVPYHRVVEIRKKDGELVYKRD